MATLFRIVFTGRIRDGLTLDSVRKAVELRLSANSAQADRIFSGRKVVLKQGLELEAARTYANRLERLGMVVVVEPVPTSADATVLKAPAPAAGAPVDTPAEAQPAPLAGNQEETWLTSSGFADLARTQVNLARAQALLSGQPELSPAPAEVPTKPLRAPEPPLPRLFGAVPPAPGALAAEVVPKVVKLPTPPVTAAAEIVEPPNTLHLSGTFRCNHCDALHQFEATVIVKLGDGHPVRQGVAS